MKILSTIFFLVLIGASVAAPAVAQRDASNPARLLSQTEAQSAAPANQTDAIATELAQLRKSLQTLNTRLQTIAEELLSPDANQSDNQKLKQIAGNLDMLTHAEERAEVLRKQLIELIEKETAYRTRLTQMEEDLRPENIERSLSGYGTTRTPELRETRRRSLESEKRGLESLLSVTAQSRLRLEEDVRQADQLVSKFRQRLFPLIERQLNGLPQ